MNRALVIGATGNIGREVSTQLIDAGGAVRVMVRDPQAASLPPQVEVYRGDLTLPDTMEAALSAIDAVFLVWTAPFAAAGPAVQRLARHARRVVYLSAPIKTPHPLFQVSQPNPSAELHAEVERHIERHFAEWTILRPGMLASNSLAWWAPQIRAGDVVRWPYLDAPTAPIDERDVASVAVRALLDDGHAGRDYVLTGPESLTQREQISTIARAIGRSLRIEQMSPDETRRAWAQWPAPVVEMLLKSWAAALGQPAYITHTVADVTGRPARTFEEWARTNAPVFAR